MRSFFFIIAKRVKNAIRSIIQSVTYRRKADEVTAGSRKKTGKDTVKTGFKRGK